VAAGIAAASVAILGPVADLGAAPDKHGLVAPTFKVDPFWPQPLPHNWVTGEVGGTCIDSRDHLFIVTRGFQTGGLASPEGVGGAHNKNRTPRGPIKYTTRAPA